MRIGIYGYGNLGRGVEKALAKNPDAELVGVFTRRNPETVKTAILPLSFCNGANLLNCRRSDVVPQMPSFPQ